MEKGLQIPAPPYPGPPLDNAGFSQQGYQTVVQPVAQPVIQPVVQPVIQPVAQPVIQPVIQPVVQPVVQPVIQPVIQPVVQPVVQPVIQPVVQPVIQPVVQPVIQTVQQHPIIQPVSQMVVVQNLPKSIPGQMLCPYCQTGVVTKVEYKIGAYTWMVCGLLAVFLCWPCCFIPFCVNDCKDVEHSCPCCNAVIHIHRRM